MKENSEKIGRNKQTNHRLLFCGNEKKISRSYQEYLFDILIDFPVLEYL